MKIFTGSNFGYNTDMVQVEVDLRRGIPAVDIVGLADSSVKESRERVKAAIKNCGFEFPSERVLISLSPADLRKEDAGFDLAVALAVLSQASGDMDSYSDVFAVGELGADNTVYGKIHPVRGIYPMLEAAKAAGICRAVIPSDYSGSVPEGMKVFYAQTLNEAFHALNHEEVFNYEAKAVAKPAVRFRPVEEDSIDDVKGQDALKYAMTVAAAGGHNLLAYGPPGCGKTHLLQKFPQLMPELTAEERSSVERIYDLAGYAPDSDLRRPFRMPHQTASIEGMCGGGGRCAPGEISLAHNGVLFLDDAAEFRASVLQMLRVPLESGSITLSRAGRSTTFPSRFQLLMATNPCPCGNLGSDRACLCPSTTVKQYWNKFSAPLLDRIDIRVDCAKGRDFQIPGLSLDKMRSMVSLAWERQHRRQGGLNAKLTPVEVDKLIMPRLDSSAEKVFKSAVDRNRENLSPRGASQVLKLAATIADMDGRDAITEKDIAMGFALRKESVLKRPLEIHAAKSRSSSAGMEY